MKLSSIKKEQLAKIVSIDDPALAIRLYEMGVLPGNLIRIKGFAPFGCPLMLEISGYMLSVRKEEADCITVEQH